MEIGTSVARADRWTLPPSLGLAWGEPAVVAGEDASAVAEAAQRAGGPPIAVAAEDHVILGRKPDVADNASWTDMPARSVGTVVLRQAWSGPDSLHAMIADARRILAPGGAVMLAAWDLDRLLSSTPRLYPDAFFYAALPEVAARLRGSMAYGLDLALALGRAGFDSVRVAEVDEVVAEFADPTAYLAWLEERGFRGIRFADPDRLGVAWAATPQLVRTIAPLGAVEHREPWRVAIGIGPG